MACGEIPEERCCPVSDFEGGPLHFTWRRSPFPPVPFASVFSASHYGFNPRELRAIYLGISCGGDDRADLLRLLGHGLEQVLVYQAHAENVSARFVFDKIC